MANPILKSIEVAFRRGLLQALRLAGRFGSGQNSGLAPEEIIRQFGSAPSILLMRQDRFGDVMMSTFLMMALRKKFPESRIALLLGKNNEAIEPLLPAKFEIFVYRKNLAKDLKTIREIRDQHFDIAIDLTDKASVTASFLISMLGAKVKIGFKKENSVIYDIAVERPDQEAVHVTVRTAELLRPLGIDPNSVDRAPTLNLAVVKVLGRVGLHVSARTDDRSAPPVAAAEIARGILKLGIPEVLVFTAPHDASRAEEVVRLAADDRIHLAPSVRSFVEFAEQIATCEYLVTVDTATIQIGAAAGVPMVLMFRPIPGEHPWTPVGVDYELYTQYPGLSALEPQPVIALFQRLLERTSSVANPHTQTVDAPQTV